VSTTLAPAAKPTGGGPRPRHWSCAEFHRFGDLGAFEGRRAMLIDGVIVEEAIRAALGTGWWLRHQSPLVLGLDTDPGPDLAVVPGRPRDYTGHPTSA